MSFDAGPSFSLVQATSSFWGKHLVRTSTSRVTNSAPLYRLRSTCNSVSILARFSVLAAPRSTPCWYTFMRKKHKGMGIHVALGFASALTVPWTWSFNGFQNLHHQGNLFLLRLFHYVGRHFRYPLSSRLRLHHPHELKPFKVGAFNVSAWRSETEELDR